MYRVKVYPAPHMINPDASFGGMSVYDVEDPTQQVEETETGSLEIRTAPTPAVPAHGPYRGRKATRGSLVRYPHGAWAKVIITDIIEEEA